MAASTSAASSGFGSNFVGSSKVSRNIIMVHEAILTVDERLFPHVKNPPRLNVTKQVEELFLNEKRTWLYIPKEYYAKRLLMLYHFRETRAIGSKPLEFINNKYLKDMRHSVLKLVIFYADSKISVDIHGNECLYLVAIENPNHGCKLEFQYGSLMTPAASSTGGYILASEATSGTMPGTQRIVVNNRAVAKTDNPLVGDETVSNGIVYRSVLSLLQQKVFEACVKDTLIQRACINNLDEINSQFQVSTPLGVSHSTGYPMKLKIKFRINRFLQHVEVLSKDESITVIAVCDLGVDNAANKDRIVQLADSHLFSKEQPPPPSHSSLIQVKNAAYRHGQDYRNVTEQVKELLCHNTLFIPSRDKGYYLDAFFEEKLGRGEDPKLEVSYSIGTGAADEAAGQLITESVHEREALLLLAPSEILTQEEDRLQCIASGRFTPHLLNDTSESTRKKMVSNALYLREEHKRNITSRIKDRIHLMSVSLHSYQYALVRYGRLQLLWVGEHSDGIKVIGYPTYGNPAEVDRQNDNYLQNGRRMSEDVEFNNHDEMYDTRKPQRVSSISEVGPPAILTSAPPPTTTAAFQTSAPTTAAVDQITPVPNVPVAQETFVERTVPGTEVKNPATVNQQQYPVADQSSQIADSRKQYFWQNTSAYVNKGGEYVTGGQVPPNTVSEQIVASPSTSNAVPDTNQSQVPVQTQVAAPAQILLPVTIRSEVADNVQPSPAPSSSASENLTQPSSATNNTENKSSTSDKVSVSEMTENPIPVTTQSGARTALPSEVVPPIFSIQESPESASGVHIESRFMQALDSISIQVYNNRTSLADVLMRSDIYSLIIFFVWLFIVASDPSLYVWIHSSFIFARETINFLGNILRDTALAGLVFIIFFILKNPEMLPVFISKMRTGRMEMEKVQVARETVLGKMFDLYVWLIKKTKRRQLANREQDTRKAQGVVNPSRVTVNK